MDDEKALKIINAHVEAILKLLSKIEDDKPGLIQINILINCFSNFICMNYEKEHHQKLLNSLVPSINRNLQHQYKTREKENE